MVDTEVQKTLSEIRERVRAGDAVDSGRAELVRESAARTRTPELIARLEGHSQTTLRAWDRLPPLTSKRRGLWARLELWFKRQMRRATHWYAWEQVNFNAAVKEALLDVTAALSNHEREVQSLRQRLASLAVEAARTASHLAAVEWRAAEFESALRRLDERFALLDERFAALKERALPASAAADARGLKDEMQAVRASLHGLRAEVEEGLARLRAEQRARAEQLQDEHRASFKQLSLEIKEQAKRAGRKAES